MKKDDGSSPMCTTFIAEFPQVCNIISFAATKAEVAKCQKYHHVFQSNYHFQPVAIETTGVYGKSNAPFLSGLSKKLVDVSGDPREHQWLHHRLSLALARGNAASILACVQVWPGEMLPAYWPVCKFDLILPVPFPAPFNVLTTICQVIELEWRSAQALSKMWKVL